MKTRIALLLLLAMVSPRTLWAAGDQTGRIRGTITEAETGMPVPGASVKVTGKKLIGGPQTVLSSDDGAFLLSDLPPGPYDIEIAYAGMKPLKRKAVVRQNETLPLDVEWSAELTNVEVTEVQVSRRLTRPDSTHTGTVLSFDTEKRLATQRTHTDVAQQVAGIKVDRGLPVVKGATRLSNRYIIDGMDITDSVTNNFATQINFDSISSMEVLTGGMEAQYNAMGGVISVNTNGGSDEFHLDSSVYVNNQELTAKTVYGSQLYNNELAFNSANLGPNQSYLGTLNVSGPLLKQKLWYGLSLEYDFLQSSVQPSTPLLVQHPARTEHAFRPRLKITAAPADKHRITWSTSADPALVANRSQSNSSLGIAEYGQAQGGFFSVLQWDYFRSQNVSTNVQAGYNYNTLHQLPMGQLVGGALLDYGRRDPRFSDKNYQYDSNQPQHVNASDGTTWYQAGSENKDLRHTIQFDPSISVRGQKWGDHDAKFGLQTRAVYKVFNQHTPGGAVYRDNAGGGFEAGLCDPATGVGCQNSQVTYTPDFTTRTWGFGAGVFAQDRWKVTKYLTLLPGMRFDYGMSKNSVNQLVSSQWGIGPRLGATVDVTGDQKTIITAFYGRSNETFSLLSALYADPSSTSETQRWDTTANGGQGGFVFRNASGGTGGYKLDPSAKAPHTDEITAGINREFYTDSVASIQYTYKRISNIWQEVETNQIWDATGSRVVGYADGTPHQVFLYTTPDGAFRTYHGIDFVVESRPTPNWDFYAGYTLSWLFGPGSEQVHTVGGGNPFANPRQTRFYEGFLPEDTRHQIKLHASYQFHGLSLGANLVYSSGTPLTKMYWNAFTNSYSNRRSPQGTEPGGTPNDIKSFATFRNPDQLQMSLRVSYDLHELTKQHIVLIADVFNMFNLAAPLSVESRDIPTFGQTQARQTPIKLQLAARYMF